MSVYPVSSASINNYYFQKKKLKKSSNPYNYMPYKNFREMRTNLSELQNYLVMSKAYSFGQTLR